MSNLDDVHVQDTPQPADDNKHKKVRRSASATPPSSIRRVVIIILVLFSVFLAYAVQKHITRQKQKPQIIYASRYSKEFKYRPAASPIITETLRDGRIRLRGAEPPAPTPPPKPTPKRTRRTRRKKTKKAAADKK